MISAIREGLLRFANAISYVGSCFGGSVKWAFTSLASCFSKKSAIKSSVTVNTVECKKTALVAVSHGVGSSEGEKDPFSSSKTMKSLTDEELSALFRKIDTMNIQEKGSALKCFIGDQIFLRHEEGVKALLGDIPNLSEKDLRDCFVLLANKSFKDESDSCVKQAIDKILDSKVKLSNKSIVLFFKYSLNSPYIYKKEIWKKVESKLSLDEIKEVLSFRIMGMSVYDINDEYTAKKVKHDKEFLSSQIKKLLEIKSCSLFESRLRLITSLLKEIKESSYAKICIKPMLTESLVQKDPYLFWLSLKEITEFEDFLGYKKDQAEFLIEEIKTWEEGIVKESFETNVRAFSTILEDGGARLVEPDILYTRSNTVEKKKPRNLALDDAVLEEIGTQLRDL